MTNGDGYMGKSLKRDVENKLYAPVGAWLVFSDGFICTLDKRYKELYKMRYITRESVRKTCVKMHISRTTYYIWRDKILRLAVREARKDGLIGGDNVLK